MEKIKPSKNYSSIVAKQTAFGSLSQFEIRLLAFFLKQIPPENRTPKSVPLAYIAKSTHLTLNQTQYNIEKLITKGLLERFTAYQNPTKKLSYYRLRLH